MRLRDVMVRKVQTIEPHQSVREAAVRMAALDVAGLPVCRDGALLGQVTDRDITIKVTAQGIDPDEATVADVMTAAPLRLFEDQTVEEARAVMARHQLRRLIVVDRDQRMAGIVAWGDLALEAKNSDEAKGGR